MFLIGDSLLMYVRKGVERRRRYWTPSRSEPDDNPKSSRPHEYSELNTPLSSLFVGHLAKVAMVALSIMFPSGRSY